MAAARKRCGHCDQYLVMPVYKRHKDLYFDSQKGQWSINSDICMLSSDEDSQTCDECDDDETMIYVAGTTEADLLTDEVDNEHSDVNGNDTDDDAACIMTNEDKVEYFSPSEVCGTSQPVDSSSDDSETVDEVWDIEEQAILDDFYSEADTDQEESMKSLHWILIFIMMWSTTYKVSAAAIGHLLKFISYLLKWLAPTSTLAKSFPGSLHKIKQALNLENDNFVKFVVCPSCHELYNFNSCYDIIGTKTVPKCCSKIHYPLHPQKSRRTKCNHSLLRKVTLKNHAEKVYPLKVYSYKSVKESLCEIISRPGILDKCEEWRSRDVPVGSMFDVYDGKVWSDFMIYNGRNFLAEKANLALIINVDWFQPFKRTEYSVGVIYLAVLNLPRSMRYRIENIIIVGIIPGPKEPSSLNSYLSPLVDELLDLWDNGINVSADRGLVTVRAAILCAACDTPAARKLCGFLGHSSRHCPRCDIQFFYDKLNKKMNYSGVTEFPLKDNTLHVQHAKTASLSHTPTEREEYEHQHGARYSELMRLPYFNCVRFTIIDPMHNLFLGTSKHLMKNIWLGEEIALLSSANMLHIQKIVDATKLPSSIGRLPNNIQSNFLSFTADQWKNWMLYISSVALYGVLPEDHLKCWKCFVAACTFICSPKINLEIIEKSHLLFLEFQQKFECLYGQLRVTPNIHMHRHLKECLIDYGPVYGFWLFSFERFNGVLGSYHTNQKAIEIQLMRKFLSDSSIYTLTCNDNSIEQHKNLFIEFLDVNNSLTKGSLRQTFDFALFSSAEITNLLDLPLAPLKQSLQYLSSCSIHCCGPYRRKLFDDDSHAYLLTSYSKFIPSLSYESVPIMYESFNELFLWGNRIGCTNSRLERCSCIKANWACENGSIINNENTEIRSGFVEFFFRQALQINGKQEIIIMASVKWFQSHPNKHKLGDPTELWVPNLFIPYGPSAFMPVTRIITQCCYTSLEVDNETLLAISPLKPKILL